MCKNVNLFLKRIFDIIFGIFGVIILMPVTLVIFIINLLNKQRKIFYIQERIGKNGKPFKMLKFNSMVDNADKVLEKYLKENESAAKEYKKYKKIKNDPRITKVGAFLRRTSLDELPQVINVVKGDMSLIGPRPYLPREKGDMDKYYKVITSVKPGLTGPWQVSGRNSVPFRERLSLESRYADKNNIFMDSIIILKTAKTIFEQKGAF